MTARPALGLALLLGCRPDFGTRDSLVTHLEVLAVRGEPPEVKPGETARYSLLVATPAGPMPSALAGWAFCTTPKLLTDNGATSAACLSSGARSIAGGSPDIAAPLPADACALFGPEITSAGLRPRDPDVTGGYFQPLRVTVDQTITIGLERVSCNLANASADITSEFAKRYVANNNPELGPIAVLKGGAPLPPSAIPIGATVTLRASWPESSAEHYVVHDLASGTLVDRREAMRVSWYVTAGDLASDRTGRAEDELDTFTDNMWTAPLEARTVHVFVVLRDSRGGAVFTTEALVTTR
jgi:hypothetical protein